MKFCKYCNKHYPESDFGVALSTPRKIYRRLKCRFCYGKTKKALVAKYQKILDSYKVKSGCIKCGTKDYRVLDFHHTANNKEFSIGSARYNHFGIERVKKEIEKCAVVCANCHRIIHYGQVWQHDKEFRKYRVVKRGVV